MHQMRKRQSYYVLLNLNYEQQLINIICSLLPSEKNRYAPIPKLSLVPLKLFNFI